MMLGTMLLPIGYLSSLSKFFYLLLGLGSLVLIERIMFSLPLFRSSFTRHHHHSPNHYHESLSETNRRQAEAAVNGAVTYNKLKAGASVKHRKWPTATCFDSFAFAFFISVSIRCKCLMCSVVRQNKIEIQMLRIGICIGQKNCFDKQETNDLNKI